MGGSQHPVFYRRIMGIETEYGIATRAHGQRTLGPDEASRYLFRPVMSQYRSTNIFTTNGSRLYLDVGSHPEYATAECDSLAQIVAYDRAGDVLMNRLARTAEEALDREGIGGHILLLRNNVDSVGNSYGCHENYLIGRHTVLKSLGKQLVPFLITRQLICGTGMISKPSLGRKGPAAFVLSQRADQVWEGVSSATTRSRPIINTRDEPHADAHRFRRMHVIVGDSNVAEPTCAVKIGSTLLVLEMLEAGFPLPDLELENPIAQIRDISRDQTGATLLHRKDGSTLTALELQQELYRAASSWMVKRSEISTHDTRELYRVLDLWERMLHAIETQDFSQVDTEIDWVIKKKLLDAYREKLGLEGEDCWNDPKLAHIDLSYHDIHPSRGIRAVLERRGHMSTWVDKQAVEYAADHAPQSTRAACRGTFLAKARELGAPVTVDWLRMKVNQPEPQVIEISDPFDTQCSDLGKLLEYMAEHAEFYQRGTTV